ncbi:M15 family metallopeptidase [Streptomyces sp. KLOTTS4A1]|uniref:M15 family metallopeptidase n=1 Tax=Streptomyces sp. KLOTTS4A1 TaxID=3390996 RepID=UPI0039F46D65
MNLTSFTTRGGREACRARTRMAALVLAGAALTAVGGTGCQSADPSSSADPSASAGQPPGAEDTPPESLPSPSTSRSSSPSSSPSPSDGTARPRPDHRPLGQADGAVPSGTRVFDDLPAVSNLEPALRTALRRAATDAAKAGVTFTVNSGWRSAAYQEELFRKAIAEHGSKEEAARWVATPATSQHVSGKAVDLGTFRATTWLSGHGAAYGLCQIYRNEPWHYELRPAATSHGCPPMYADPTDDPRMGQ